MSEVGDKIKTSNANWRFNEDVVDGFDSHVSKSVPFYEEGHDLVKKISDFFISDYSVCYEIGCSTGSLLKLLDERNSKNQVSLIGIDNEKAMVKYAKNKCKDNKSISILHSDALDFEFKKSDLIISYYTMQFIKPRNRQILMDRIYESLNWGGAFILFEKVRAPDARFQDIATALYTDFKIDNKYTSEEIINKTKSLKGILEPFSTQANFDLLKRSGFKDTMSIMKYVCFQGFLAIK
tara:strand:- start:740 stop:1450 length:711 start_codon:yes stop_codon:yes gene_type:complete